MIHSLTFRHLSPPLKSTVVKMLNDVLSGKDTSGTFDYLGESERNHILAILQDTGVLPKA
jgi:ABC-type multidrug transport system ATPase subunit